MYTTNTSLAYFNEDREVVDQKGEHIASLAAARSRGIHCKLAEANGHILRSAGTATAKRHLRVEEWLCAIAARPPEKRISINVTLLTGVGKHLVPKWWVLDKQTKIERVGAWLQGDTCDTCHIKVPHNTAELRRRSAWQRTLHPHANFHIECSHGVIDRVDKCGGLIEPEG